MKRLQLAAKRLTDVAVSALGLLLLSPLLAALALLVRATMGKPVLFRQKRPGKDEKLFMLYKFRTMTDARGPDGELLADGERLTKLRDEEARLGLLADQPEERDRDQQQRNEREQGEVGDHRRKVCSSIGQELAEHRAHDSRIRSPDAVSFDVC